MTITLIKQETIHAQLNDVQLIEAAVRMSERGGGFASCIGNAYLRADSVNSEKLLRTFPELFIKFAPRKEADPYQ